MLVELCLCNFLGIITPIRKTVEVLVEAIVGAGAGLESVVVNIVGADAGVEAGVVAIVGARAGV